MSAALIHQTRGEGGGIGHSEDIKEGLHRSRVSEQRARARVTRHPQGSAAKAVIGQCDCLRITIRVAGKPAQNPVALSGICQNHCRLQFSSRYIRERERYNYGFCFGRISKADCARKKQTSNSRKKLTWPNSTGTAVICVQANARRTGGKDAIVAERTTARAGAWAKFPVSWIGVFC